MSTLHSKPLRRLSLMAGALVAAAALLPASPAATAQTAPAPHWGTYHWDGQEAADIRAFWLVDRTGDPTAQGLIQWVADAWNSARDDHEELPFIGVFKDSAGPCFVNETPGYSVASACMFQNIPWASAIAATNPDDTGHMVGGAFAIRAGMDWKETLTAICYGFGHVMGLDDSANEESCMFPDSQPDEIKWYDEDDTAAVLALYDHEDGTPASTTTTAVQATTTTVGSPTTSTTVAPTTTTTVAPTTTTTPVDAVCDVVPLPVVCQEEQAE